jgi:hypothetical protein
VTGVAKGVEQDTNHGVPEHNRSLKPQNTQIVPLAPYHRISTLSCDCVFLRVTLVPEIIELRPPDPPLALMDVRLLTDL